MSSQKPAEWELTDESLVADCRVYHVYKQHYKHPYDKREGDFFVNKCNHWAMALALTEKNEVILVNQFRFGSQKLSWEVPGGIIDDADTDPILAAERELLEETGYKGDPGIQLSWCHPNPAILNNKTFFILFKNCKKVADLALDNNEEIELKTVTVEEAVDMVLKQELTHSLAINAILLLKTHLEKNSI